MNMLPPAIDPMAIERIVKNPSLISGSEYDDGESSVAESTTYSRHDADAATGPDHAVRPLSGATNHYMFSHDNPFGANHEEAGRPKKKRRGAADASEGEDDRVSVQINELSEILRKKGTEMSALEDTECWGCKNGLLVPVSGPAAYPAPFELIAKCIKESLHFVSVAHIVSTVKSIYDKDIKPYTRDNYGRQEEWSKESIREHLFEHVTNPALDMKAKLTDLNLLYKAVRGSVAKRENEDSDRIEIDPKMLHSLGYISEQIRKLYSMSTEKSSAFTMHITPYSEFKYNKANGTSKKM